MDFVHFDKRTMGDTQPRVVYGSFTFNNWFILSSEEDEPEMNGKEEPLEMIEEDDQSFTALDFRPTGYSSGFFIERK